jgi:hydrophobe/amphiphile efflux-1 (HAE1) family protein
MKLADVSIDRPVFITMVTLGVLVLGALSLSRLGVDLFPDVSFPIVTIVTPYPGAGPEEVENQVTRPIEEAVSAINGVDQVTSESRDGVSQVLIQFKVEADIQQAASDVRDHVAAIRGTLPTGVLDPNITRVDPTAIPILTYAVSGTSGSLATRQYVDDVVAPALERLDGVGSVTVSGGDVREIQVDVDQAKMDERGLTVSQIAQALQAQSFDLPGGHLDAGAKEIDLKAVGTFQKPQDIAQVVLVARPDGSQIRVGDVATVVDGVAEERSLTRVNGVDAVTFDVQKRGGTNTVAVVDQVESALDELRPQLPNGTAISRVVDTSGFIRNNMSDLKRALLLGGIFAVLVIFLFMLDWRSTLISALALPTSVIATFVVMYILGFTLNIMTMMGLSLAIGLLIDDSVVVRENIFRHMERGEDPVTAARRGTGEIALAVMATTMTIVAVFGPVAFTGGIIGKFFREFGITVSAAVLVSLLVSFTLDPMLSSRLTQALSEDHRRRQLRHPIYGPIVRALDAVDSAYKHLLAWTVEHRKTVIGGAVVLFVGSIMLVPLMGTEFSGRGDEGNFTVNLQLPAGTSLAETSRVASQVEGLIHAFPEIVTIATTVGPNQEVNTAQLQVVATPKTERKRSIEDLMEILRPELTAIPGLTFNMREADLGGGSNNAAEQAPIVIYVRGPDYQKLGQLATQAFDLIKATQGIRDAAISYQPGGTEQQLVIDRAKAADLQAPYATVAATLRTAVQGEVVGQFREGEHEADIRVELAGGEQASLDQIRSLVVPSASGQPVYLRDVTDLQETPIPSTISRRDRAREITISANVMGRSLGEVVTDIKAKLAAMNAPAGYDFEFQGEAKQMAEAFGNLGLALALSIVFIYLVLASQFESFLHPFTIMIALPLAIVGALLLLFLANYPIGMAPLIGIILLMGLVTKNSILLVDHANQARDRGMRAVDAVLEAGASRLRPILMTSAAMVLGMLPTALGHGEGSEFRAPMSTAVIGGVLTSTLLTLVVVPVVYLWVDRFTLRGRRERRAARAAARLAA